ncbi:TPA: hypothetical protein N2D99_001981 [Clostridium botulinum]|nr:hypothetical protein [Clostridium botulinum]
MRKKAFTYLFLFPPYGIYLLYKHKIVNPMLTTVITLIMFLIIGVTIDTVVNPYRLHNLMADKTIKEFNIKNKNKLGDIRFIERKDDIIKVKDINYFKYGIYTNKGKYYMYLKTNNNKLEIDGIYKIEPQRSPIYGENILPKYISKVFPEITLFLEGNKDKFGEYKNLERNIDKETQIVKTTKGYYKIEVKYEQVTKVFKLGANGEGEEVYSKEPIIKLNSKIAKGMKQYKEAGDIDKVICDEFFLNKISQTVKTSNGLFKFDLYDDGSIKVFKGGIK